MSFSNTTGHWKNPDFGKKMDENISDVDRIIDEFRNNPNNYVTNEQILRKQNNSVNKNPKQPRKKSFNYHRPLVKNFKQEQTILDVLRNIFDIRTKQFLSVQVPQFQKDTICIVFEEFTWQEERYVLIQSPNSSGDIVYLLKANDIENYVWAGTTLEDYLDLENLYKEKHQYDLRLEICKFLLPQINAISDIIYNNPLSLVSRSLFPQLTTRANMNNITRKNLGIEDTTQNAGSSNDAGNIVAPHSSADGNGLWNIANNYWEEYKTPIHTGFSGSGELGLYSFAGQNTLRPWIYGRMSNFEFTIRLAAIATSAWLQEIAYQMQYPIATHLIKTSLPTYQNDLWNRGESLFDNLYEKIYKQLIKDSNSPYKSIMTKMKFEKDLHKLASLAAEKNKGCMAFWSYLNDNGIYLSGDPFDIGVLLNEFERKYPAKFDNFKGTALHSQIEDVKLDISPEVFEFQYQEGTNSEDIIMLDALQEKSRFHKYTFNSDDHFILTLLGTKLDKDHIKQLKNLWTYDFNDNKVENSLYSTVQTIRNLAINRIRFLNQCLANNDKNIGNFFKEGSPGLEAWKNHIGEDSLPTETNFLNKNFKTTKKLLDKEGIFTNHAVNMEIYNNLGSDEKRTMEQYMIDQGNKIIEFLTENTEISDTDKYILFAGIKACKTAKKLDQEIANAYVQLTDSPEQNGNSPEKPSMPINTNTAEAEETYMKDTDIAQIVSNILKSDTTKKLTEQVLKEDLNKINVALGKVIKGEVSVDELIKALEPSEKKSYTNVLVNYYKETDSTLSNYLGNLATVQTNAEAQFIEAYEEYEKEPSKNNLNDLKRCYNSLPQEPKDVYKSLLEKLSKIDDEKRWLNAYYKNILKKRFAFFTPKNIIFFPSLAIAITWLYKSTLAKQKIDIQLFRRALFAHYKK